MSGYRVAPEACDDLGMIWDYLARDNVAAAGALLDTFFDKFDLLGDHPQAGREREDLGHGMRSLAAGSYVIYYYRAGSDVNIARVIHGARDVKNAL
jgi:toxin ParE1/3/4